MDNFVEQLSRKRSDGLDILKQSLILLLTFVLATLAMFGINYISYLSSNESIARFGGFFSVLAACAIMYLGLRFYNNTNIEYEYTVTGDQLDIDKIINKKKRKHMLTVCIKDFESFGPLTENTDASGVFATVQAVYNRKAKTYYAVFDHESYGKTMLVFNPNEKLLNAVNTVLPGKLRNTVVK